MIKRVFIIVCDSLGIGKAPDAEAFGDSGTDTLRALVSSDRFSAPTLEKLGLFNIDGVDYRSGVRHPLASYGRAEERSAGKDSTIGHWEISGIFSKEPLPTFPDGFPDPLIRKLEATTGRKLVCNLPYSGTDVIRDYGEHHLMTGDLIAYTSADSVFQIAAHESIVPPQELYRLCRICRDVLDEDPGTAVGRVIARPFSGRSSEEFKRTSNRHDFSISPPSETMIDLVKEAGLDTISVGKIWDLFAGSGITEAIATKSNDDGMRAACELAGRDFSGLAFINLVEFDTVYGHRRDIDGYAQAVSVFDNQLDTFIGKLTEEDILFITADHGCDPSYTLTTDHTRECVPVLVYCRSLPSVDLGVLPTFADIGCTACECLGIPYDALSGNSFLKKITG